VTLLPAATGGPSLAVGDQSGGSASGIVAEVGVAPRPATSRPCSRASPRHRPAPTSLFTPGGRVRRPHRPPRLGSLGTSCRAYREIGGSRCVPISLGSPRRDPPGGGPPPPRRRRAARRAGCGPGGQEGCSCR